MSGDSDPDLNPDSDVDPDPNPDPDPDDRTQDLAENDSTRFDRLPATATERVVEGRATRRAVLEWWDERFGIDPETFEEHTFWEKGAGKVWVVAGDAASPIEIEALGMTFLRTRQEHWKPTTDAVQRFGHLATRNVIDLDDAQARRFLAGDTQEVEWDGDWGYLIATRETAGDRAPLGVGLYTYGELKSMIPKGRRRDL